MPTEDRNLPIARASAAEKLPLTVVAYPALRRRHSTALAWAPREPWRIVLYLVNEALHVVAALAGSSAVAVTETASATPVNSDAVLFRILPIRWVSLEFGWPAQSAATGGSGAPAGTRYRNEIK
jgi:hypothetical protein